MRSAFPGGRGRDLSRDRPCTCADLPSTRAASSDDRRDIATPSLCTRSRVASFRAPAGTLSGREHPRLGPSPARSAAAAADLERLRAYQQHTLATRLRARLHAGRSISGTRCSAGTHLGRIRADGLPAELPSTGPVRRHLHVDLDWPGAGGRCVLVARRRGSPRRGSAPRRATRSAAADGVAPVRRRLALYVLPWISSARSRPRGRRAAASVAARARPRPHRQRGPPDLTLICSRLRRGDRRAMPAPGDAR